MSPKDITSESTDVDTESETISKVKEGQNKGQYVCNFLNCNQRFKRQVKLDRHEFTHTGVRKHVCNINGCNKSYTISTHLKRHIKTVHENIRPERVIKCPIENCNATFDYECNLNRHFNEVHENPTVYPCPNCSSKFHRKIQLRKHMITHTGEYPFNCDTCKKGFLYKGLYDKHCCKKYKCELCEKEFLKWTLLVAHRKSEHKNLYKCEECKKVFKRKSYLKAHLEKHKDNEEREVLPCPWKDCTCFYYHSRNLKYHIRSKHENGENVEHLCHIEGCGKKLTSKRRLERHLRFHEIPKQELSRNKKLPKVQKATRKDKGKKKKSCASVLSGVILKPDVEKMILDGETSNIHVTIPPDSSDVADTDDDTMLSTKMVLN